MLDTEIGVSEPGPMTVGFTENLGQGWAGSDLGVAVDLALAVERALECPSQLEGIDAETVEKGVDDAFGLGEN
jgi:hypothetical protein